MLMPNWMDPEYLLHWLGDWALWGTAVVVFIECGLLFPILPGDSLLFAVGLFIAAGTINVPLWLACVILTVAAENARARRLYERWGFSVYGIEPRAIKLEDGYLDEALMVCPLR